MKRIGIILISVLSSTGLFAQEKDLSDFFVFYPEGNTVSVFESEHHHGKKTLNVQGVDYYYTTETSEVGLDTNFYWEDDNFFYKCYPSLGKRENFLPKKARVGQEWTGEMGKHRYKIEKFLESMEIMDEEGAATTYNDVILVLLYPVIEGLYSPYSYYYAKGAGLIKIVHGNNSYDLAITKE